MIIIDSIDQLPKYTQNGTAVALGNFDGLHRAHMKIIRAAAEYAKANGMKSVVYMFREHPSYFIEGASKVKYITPNPCKEELLQAAGVDVLFYASFPQVEKKSPEEFLEHLKTHFNVRFISAGFNYTFGYRASGNEALLHEWCVKGGIVPHIICREAHEGEVISSSRIRELLGAGDVCTAAHFLGRPYFISGVVEHGRKLGTTMTFPTINSMVGENVLLPKNGVYITRTFAGGEVYKSTTNIGLKPTVGSDKVTVETYIIDYRGDLYGCDVKVEFLERIRDERKFASLEALKAQIAEDVRMAAEYEPSM